MEDAAGALVPADAVGKINGSARSAITSLNKTAHEMVDRAAHTADWLAKSPEQLKKTANDYATAHPMKTVGIAFLTGLLIGRVFR